MLLVTQMKSGGRSWVGGHTERRGIKRVPLFFSNHKESLSLPPHWRPDARYTCLGRSLLLTFVCSVSDTRVVRQRFQITLLLIRKVCFVSLDVSIKSPHRSSLKRSPLTLAFDPQPTHSFSFHALSLSEAHSFGEAAFRLLEQMGQWGDTTVWHHYISPSEVSGRCCSQKRNWDGNRTTGMENGWLVSRAGSLTFNMGVGNAQDWEEKSLPASTAQQ